MVHGWGFFGVLIGSRTCVLQNTGRTQSGAGRDRTDADSDSNAGQDKGVTKWEEDGEGRAGTGGLRRRVGGGEKRGQAGDRSHVTAA